MRRAFLITAVALLSVLGAIWPVGAQQAAAPPARPADVDRARQTDFNGDSYSDLAIGVPGEDLTGAANAGIVNLLNGSANGLTANSQYLTQTNPETNDAFGTAVAKGYFNADGYVDLAVGAPGETVSGAANAGAVSVFYGSASGLVGSTQTTILQSNPEANDRFGAALDSGDFNGDGNSDLAVGAPGETVGSATSAGMVDIFLGSGSGLSGTAYQQLLQGSPETNDRYGTALASGFYNDGTAIDLAIGAPGEGVGGDAGAGTVLLHYSVNGRLASPGGAIYQVNPEPNDAFGSALSSGTFDGVLPFDLAVGSPGETFNGLANAGEVDIFTGTVSGINGNGPRTFLQSVGGVGGAAQAGDRFGAVLAAGLFHGGDIFDLAVGVPGEDLTGATDTGIVNLINGSATGPQGVSAYFSQGVGGVGGGSGNGDQFGSALARGIFFNDFNGDQFADVAVGAPGEKIGANAAAGATYVLRGSAGGLVGTSAFFYQGGGLGGGASASDRVGAALD